MSNYAKNQIKNILISNVVNLISLVVLYNNNFLNNLEIF